MTKDDLNQLLTFKDLDNIVEKIADKVSLILNKKIKPAREFITPKEFADKTGITYATVIYRCKTGRLLARQEGPNCTWQISAKELDRYEKEAGENLETIKP